VLMPTVTAPGRVWTPRDQQRLAEETARQVAS
jgi:hypothetical protein